MTDWYWPKVLRHLTVQSLVFSGSFTVERIETVAVHSTIDTERIGDSRRTCSNDEHVAGTTACFESRDLEGSQLKILQFRQAGSPGLAEVATTVGLAVQTAISNANPRSSEGQRLVDIKGLGKPPTFKR